MTDQHQRRNQSLYNKVPSIGSLIALPLIGLSSLFALSCSETPTQYTQPSTEEKAGPLEQKVPFLVTDATNPTGGHLLYQQEEILTTEEEKDISTRENSLVPINYQDGSVANINMETTYEEAQTILNFRGSTSTGLGCL